MQTWLNAVELDSSKVVHLSQTGQEELLNREEKTTIKILLKASLTPVEEELTASKSMMERLAKRKKEGLSASCYIDPSIILGSVAEVERVWSTAKFIISHHPQLMTPQLFKALIF